MTCLLCWKFSSHEVPTVDDTNGDELILIAVFFVTGRDAHLMKKTIEDFVAGINISAPAPPCARAAT